MYDRNFHQNCRFQYVTQLRPLPSSERRIYKLNYLQKWLNNSSIPTQLQQAISLDCRRRRGAIVRVLHGAVAGGVGIAFIGYVAGMGGQQVQQLQEGQDDHQRFQSFLLPHNIAAPRFSDNGFSTPREEY
jgi:hypothetical protein